MTLDGYVYYCPTSDAKLIGMPNGDDTMAVVSF